MEKDFGKTMFYRAFMTCVFAGLLGTVLCMIYDLAFVEWMHFPFSSIINVSTLIFAINIIFLVIGALYYWSVKYIRRGETIYTVTLLVLTAVLIWRLQGVERSSNAVINGQFRWLSSGIVIILGLLASVAVPAMYHNKKFDEYVL